MEFGRFFLALISVSIVSSISLIGIVSIGVKKNLLQKVIWIFVSIAAGTLIGDVFIHIIPEAYENENVTSLIPLFIMIGILSFFALEKLLHWYHCHREETHNHKHVLAVNSLIADGLHNFIDGLIIGSSYLVSVELGIATTIAVILHEIPQEIGNFGVLVHSGMSVAKALLVNFVSAFTAVIGVIITLFIKQISEEIIIYLLLFSAGGFLYLAIADLFPEIKHDDKIARNLTQLGFVVVGIILMFALTLLET